MAQRPRKLTLRFSPLIKPRLAEIWRWNANTYDETHADEFIAFLKSRTHNLQTQYLSGRIVPTRPSYRYVTLKKRSRGHGYVVIYQVLENEVNILYYFHTAQDWLTQLEAIVPKA